MSIAPLIYTQYDTLLYHWICIQCINTLYVNQLLRRSIRNLCLFWQSVWIITTYWFYNFVFQDTMTNWRQMVLLSLFIITLMNKAGIRKDEWKEWGIWGKRKIQQYSADANVIHDYLTIFRILFPFIKPSQKALN